MANPHDKSGMIPPAPVPRAETIGHSEAARAAQGLPEADDANDAIVRLGRRIGRALSMVAFVALAWIVGGQLGFW
jgi:hypothetical protein